MAGTLSWGQFELFTFTIDLPLNVGRSTDTGSGKSFCQPVLGQIGTFWAGTLQNFVYMVSCVTGRRVTLNPSFSNWSLATWACWAVGPELSATMRNDPPPVYLPLGYPAF